MIIRIAILTIALLVVPTIIGMIFVIAGQKEKEICLSWHGIIKADIYGWFVIFAVFEIMCVPMIYAKAKFTTFSVAYGIVFLVLFLGSLIYIETKRKGFRWQKTTLNKGQWMIAITGAILILYQIIYVLVFWHEDLDDSFYLGEPNTILATNKMYLYDAYTGAEATTWLRRYMLAPLQVLYALLSKISGVHPMILGHIVLVIVFIFLSYKVMILVAKSLFPKNLSQQYIFLIFICLLNIWGNYSVCTTASFLLFRIWQGKALLANALLPMLFVLMKNVIDEYKSRTNWILILLWSLSCCIVSSMGVALGCISLAAICVVVAIMMKKVGYLIKGALCAIPYIIVTVLYFMMAYNIIPF